MINYLIHFVKLRRLMSEIFIYLVHIGLFLSTRLTMTKLPVSANIDIFWYKFELTLEVTIHCKNLIYGQTYTCTSIPCTLNKREKQTYREKITEINKNTIKHSKVLLDTRCIKIWSRPVFSRCKLWYRIMTWVSKS